MMRTLDDPWELDSEIVVHLEPARITEKFQLDLYVNDRKIRLIVYNYRAFSRVDLFKLIKILKKQIETGYCRFWLSDIVGEMEVKFRINKSKFILDDKNPSLEIGNSRYFYDKNQSIDWKRTKTY